MNQFRLTIVLAIVLVALGAYLYWVDIPKERARTQAEQAEKTLLPFEQHEITGLRVRTGSEEVVLARGQGRAWKITAPMQTEADSREVEELLRALALGKISRVVEEQASALAPFGLAEPTVVLTLQAGSSEETITVGDTGPVTSTLYAMRDSDKQILLTNLSARDFLNKTLFTFRNKNLVQFNRSQLEELRLTYRKSEVALRQVEKDSKKVWYLRFPIKARADQPQVQALLFKLDELKALGFIDPGRQHRALGKRLTRPKIKIALYGGGQSQVVKLFQPDPSSGEAYAITTTSNSIYRINPTIIQDLSRDAFALRDKRLLGLDKEDIAILKVQTRAGGYTLVNQTNVWVLEGKPHETLDQQTVALLVSRVADLPAELRIIKEPGPLAPYGLASPTAEFSATAKDGQRHGKLLLGKKVGGLVYALGQGLKGVYQARADILTQIPAEQDLLPKSGGPEPPSS